MPEFPRSLLPIAIAVACSALLALWLRHASPPGPEPTAASAKAALPSRGTSTPIAGASASMAVPSGSARPGASGAAQADPFKAFIEESERNRAAANKSPFGSTP